MKKMFVTLISLIICAYLPFITQAQKVDAGSKSIKWCKDLTWSQVKEKAKAENKYIFMNYWSLSCPPCARMSSEVFTNDDVVDYFNEKFICIKVNATPNKNDSNYIFERKVLDEIKRDYSFYALPTYLFFSQAETLVYRIEGFVPVSEFLSLAKKANLSKFKGDVYSEYTKFEFDYRNGKKDFLRIPYFIKAAQRVNYKWASDTLLVDYFSYLEGLKPNELLTKNNIEFITANLNNSKSLLFSYFYPNGKSVDKIMGKSGYSKSFIDNLIYKEVVDPYLSPFIFSFFNIVNNKANDYYRNNLDQFHKSVVPNWKFLNDIIATKYNNLTKNDFERIIRGAKEEFYWQTRNKHQYINVCFQRIKCNDKDSLDINTNWWVNYPSWAIFEVCNNKDTIDIAIGWLKEALRKLEDNGAKDYSSLAAEIDTYANLIYKNSKLHGVNRFDEAIKVEEKALELVTKYWPGRKQEYQNVIEKMKRREQTWPD